jgi:purine-binding chemotaxis protein CheW
MEKQVVVFELAEEQFGVDIAAVESIIKMQAITQVPQAPAYIEGVTNLRGSVLPVVNLRRRFGLAMAAEETSSTEKERRIIVVALGDTKVGMIVDAVSEVLRIPEEAIDPTPPLVTSVNSVYITGIAKLDDRLIILLDVGKVLTEKDLEVAALALQPA